LRGESDIEEGTREERDIRSRIRERLIAAFQEDFELLYEELESRDLERVLDELESRRFVPMVSPHMHEAVQVVKFLYRAMENEDMPVGPVIETGIREAERELNGQHVEVDVDIEPGDEEVVIRRIVKKVEEGRVDELTEGEMRMFFAIYTPTDDFRNAMREQIGLGLIDEEPSEDEESGG
jgi:hypothetical protein